MKHNSKVHLIVDMQYGSTGKGLLAGYLAKTLKPDVVVTANMPNAGHTFVDMAGRTWIHKVLPNAIVSPNLKKVLIGPGAVFDVKRLEDEIADSADLLSGIDILIHPNAVVLQDFHKKYEESAEMHQRIGSTAQGSGAAMIHKIERTPGSVVIARDAIGLTPQTRTVGSYDVSYRVCTHEEYRAALDSARLIVAEGAQGYSLGINQEFYPYTTSRECTPARFLSDMMIPISMLYKVYGSARTFPIRVAGDSGRCYDDQVETTWSQIGQKEELTTVTKKVRRVFTFSRQQMRDAVWEIQPNVIFLNFCNYLSAKQTAELVDEIRTIAPQSQIWTGHGPSELDVIPF